MTNNKVLIHDGAKFIQGEVEFTVVKRSGLNITLRNDETGEILNKMKYSKLTKYWTAV